MMKRIKLSKSGPECSRLVYGTWRLMATKPDAQEIVTKAGICVPNPYHPERRTAHYNATGARLIKSLEKSLRLLGTDQVDLFLVHRPDWLTRADDTTAGLNDLMQSGKINAAGVSNYSASLLTFFFHNRLLFVPLSRRKEG